MFRVGIDIGGTFTDIVLLEEDGRRVFLWKTLTTPDDPARGAVEGLDEALRAAGADPREVSSVIHGTTLVANLLIERKGARTALLTTRGFRDVLAIGRERRFDMYDLFLEMPEPLVPRAWRKEATERVDEKGEILVPLEEGEVREVLAELREGGVESLAVCFLHSYRNPAHERAVARIVEKEAPGLFCSLSADVLPEIREWERLSTTVANAYARPVLKDYLSRLSAEVEKRGVRDPMAVMLSSGGITSVETAETYPVRVVESGPAAGAFGAAKGARALGWETALSFDMGGTTAKLCLIERGEPVRTHGFEVARAYRHKRGSGLPLRIPVIDLVEVGAGGGSIARADALGLLKVGPDSAGADPGPACYGRGGEQPTVTDADLLLGYLNPDYFLGGRLRLFPEEARRAVEDAVARPLGLSIEEAAWGIHRIVNEHMAAAARLHAIERGWTVSGLPMVAFGGAGPVHACGMARTLGLAQVAFPPAAGVLSALGFLVAPPAFDLVRTHPMRLGEFDAGKAEALLEEMREEALRTLARPEAARDRVCVWQSADMRYVGQGHEITVHLPQEDSGPLDANRVRERFEREYRKIYHVTNAENEVEVLTWRVRVAGRSAPLPPADGRPIPPSPVSLEKARKGERRVFLPEVGGFSPCPVYDRYRLPPGAEFRGPAVIEERESTVVVGDRSGVEVDPGGNLIVTLGQAARPEGGIS